MKVMHARKQGAQSELRTDTFTGAVWGDPIMTSTDNVTMNNVFFAPGGRTHWHQHETGQVLVVTAGSGWVCKDGETPQRIRTGDMVWIAPGERHWHGADDVSFLSHIAISLGKTQWADAVTAAHFAATKAA